MQIVSVRRNLLRSHLISKCASCESAPAETWKQVIVYTLSSMGSDLTQPTSTSLTLPLASFLLLKSFYELCCVFELPTCNLYQPVSPICLVASALRCVNQYVRVLLYESFFHSGIIIWPANLMCWNVLPVCDVLAMPV